MSLTHMYFLLISLVILFSFLVFWWYYNRKEKNKLAAVLPWLVSAMIIPAIVLLSLKHFSDPVKDRPVEPYGIEAYTLNFGSTFFPLFPPFDKTWTGIL